MAWPAETTLLADFHQRTCLAATEEVVGELAWQGFRLVVAHRPDVAARAYPVSSHAYQM